MRYDTTIAVRTGSNYKKKQEWLSNNQLICQTIY